MKAIKKAKDLVKMIVDTFKDYLKALPWWGRVLFVVIFLLLDIIIPVVILTPVTAKVTNWHLKKMNEKKDKEDK
jgi:ABC-type Na+ efflux pump permease subunit